MGKFGFESIVPQLSGNYTTIIGKASQSFASADAKKNKKRFRSGVYVNENTSRGASVELSAFGGQPRRLSETQLFLSKKSFGLL